MQVAGGVWFGDNEPTHLLAFSLTRSHLQDDMDIRDLLRRFEAGVGQEDPQPVVPVV